MWQGDTLQLRIKDAVGVLLDEDEEVKLERGRNGEDGTDLSVCLLSEKGRKHFVTQGGMGKNTA